MVGPMIQLTRPTTGQSGTHMAIPPNICGGTTVFMT
jgi:hypothetical protein